VGIGTYTSSSKDEGMGAPDEEDMIAVVRQMVVGVASVRRSRVGEPLQLLVAQFLCLPRFTKITGLLAMVSVLVCIAGERQL
jgi:hypothetical protein